MKNLLEIAINIASNAHLGQKDKIGDPYIFHPIRVMQSMESINGKIVAILHDVVEDTDWTFENLEQQGFPQTIINPLKNLTKNEDETYDSFIQRAASHPVSLKVKMMDIEDNLLPWRQIRIVHSQNDERVKKYRQAWLTLEEVAKNSEQLTLIRSI